MGCVTGKNGYYSEDEANEALIRSHISFSKPAVNYYLCNDCGEYHLTSQGVINPLLDNPEIKDRIRKEKQSQDWEGRFRR